MIQAIIDSGSTKADWRIATSEEIISFQTGGMNPYFNTHKQMKNSILENVLPQLHSLQIDQLFFYGAGCAAEERKKQVYSVMRECFPHAQILVETDLLGAARALLGNRTGLIAILGTGTNTGFFNGNYFDKNVDSAGYLLGDEGSGAYLGKLILRNKLRNGFTVELNEKFASFCSLSREEIFSELYHGLFPNRFLAGFALFAFQNIHEPQIQSLIRLSFKDFIHYNVMLYECHKIIAIHFSGSVAYAFRDLLRQECNEMGVKMGEVIQTPIERLLNYHLSGPEIDSKQDSPDH